MSSNQDSGRLPIRAIEREIVEALRACPRLVIQSPTGSGKSTQVPAMLLDHGLLGPKGQAIILQPRRLAARMLARRVASERRTTLGGEVGYRVRFDRCATAATRLIYETDGVLLRQMLDSPMLASVSAVVFDEFHERHLYGDLSLGLCLRLQQTQRPDLLLVVMSATLDAAALERYLAPCRVLRADSRQYPVTIEYLPRPLRPDRTLVWDAAAEAVEEAASRTGPSGALVFMPGGYEIRRTVASLERRRGVSRSRVFPLYGELPPAEQDAAMAEYAEPKIVVATNVAETSITIPGITLVVDSGLARKARFDPHRGINTLPIEKISRASAEQRAGRAGRTAPGRCLRLWTEREHGERPAQDLPEIRCVELCETVLMLKALGVPDARAFPWLDAPDEKALEHADELLADLGAIDRTRGAITPLGAMLLAFPIHPRCSRMLVTAEAFGCLPDAALAVAIIEEERSLFMPAQNRDVRERRLDLVDRSCESDLIWHMGAWKHAARTGYDRTEADRLGLHADTARRVGRLREQLLSIAGRVGLRSGGGAEDLTAVRKCVFTGFSDQLARRLHGGTRRCELVRRRRGTLDDDSLVRSDLFVASEINEIGRASGEIEVRLSLATGVEQAWLDEFFPGEIEVRREVIYDTATKRVRAEARTVFRELTLSSEAAAPTQEEAAAILAREVRAGRLTLREWNHAVEQWIVRLNRLASWWPELGLPPIREEDRIHLLEQICLGAFSYKDIKDKHVWPTVRGWLSPGQIELLNQHAPERVKLANGREPRVTYDAAQAPFIALRIQELFGVKRAPTLAGGRVGVVVHILAPNQRPVQITEDLASFWRDAYPRVKQELQRKYPKHEWR